MSPPAVTISLYATFVHAFSYTLAIEAVQQLVESGGHDLLVLASVVAILLVLVKLLRSEVDAAFKRLQASPSQWQHTYELLEGPTQMFIFLLQTSEQVLIQFMSTSLGRWAISLAGSSVATVVPTFALGTALLWLLGASTGLAAP